MTTSRLPRALLMLAVAGSLALADEIAAADEALDACSAAAVTGQKLRHGGKLREAKSWFEVCARPTCREDIVRDCRTWQDAVGGLLPSILIHANDPEGRPVPDARIVIDGAPLPHDALAQPVVLDPGPHTVDFERPGTARVSRSIVLAEGEHSELVQVLASPPPRERAPEAVTREPSRSIPMASVVAGAVSIAGLVAFGTLAAVGYGDWRGSGCDVECPADDARRVRTTLLVADVTLALGIVAGGLATFLFFDGRSSRQKRTPAAARFDGTWRF